MMQRRVVRLEAIPLDVLGGAVGTLEQHELGVALLFVDIVREFSNGLLFPPHLEQSETGLLLEVALFDESRRRREHVQIGGV